MTRWKIYLKGTLVLDWSPPSRASTDKSAKVCKRLSRQRSAGSATRVRLSQSKKNIDPVGIVLPAHYNLLDTKYYCACPSKTTSKKQHAEADSEDAWKASA